MTQGGITLKIDRLLGIIVLLIHRKKMKAADLSRYFEVSERTIYRDIDSLNRAGFPIVSLPGQEGGYELMDGFRLDKSHLTLEDLFSITWSLKSMEQATGFEDISKLISKINKFIDSTPIEDPKIQLHFSNAKNHIQTIYKAIQHSKVIEISYIDHKGKETKRAIEPMGIYLSDSNWYTWAYCLLREELRVFKITRIIEANNTTRSFNRRPFVIEDIDANREKSVKNRTPFTVHLQFKNRTRAKVLDDFREKEITSNQDGTINVVRDYYTMDQAISQILSYGNQVRIIYPKELITKLTKHIEQIKQLYK